MKAMKKKLQTAVVITLGVVGLLAAVGEPASDADFTTVMIVKTIVWLVSWLLAAILGKHWDVDKSIED